MNDFQMKESNRLSTSKQRQPGLNVCSLLILVMICFEAQAKVTQRQQDDNTAQAIASRIDSGDLDTAGAAP